MFNSIRRSLGISSNNPAPQDAFEQLNTVAPLKSGQDEGATEKSVAASSFVCREPFLDRTERICGYEFALHPKLQSRMMGRSVTIRRVYDDAMLRNLAPLGVSTLLGARFALIRLSTDSLRNPLLEAYANLNAIIMITPDTLGGTDLSVLRADLQHLRDIGVKHGWTINRAYPELAEFLDMADLIEIESNTLDGMQLKALSNECRQGKSSPKLLVSKVQTSDDFNLCYQSSFDYYMGPFVSSREGWWRPAKSEVNRMRVLEALNMVRSGAEFDAITECLRNDPILVFKLLRYINSPGIGLMKKIDDISQVLLILGRDRFYRWLSLLMFDLNQPGYREQVLNEQSLTRARFMETLAGRGLVPDSADQLFITGLFSLLDVMMSQPLEDVLKQIALPEAVNSALRGEPGAMRDALLLGIAAESAEPEEMAAAAAQCGLDASEVAGLMIDALAWAQQVISTSE